ncbi:MAG: flavodoxin family protein [Candidatus Makaraimicrobium thalassicum]|nr:MAG: flavodoxin family protein [Candidatus Omnitrophota bacterium]
MKVIGISGSPRRGGNTDILLEEALRGAASRGAETEKIVLNELKVSPCQEEEYENVNDEGLSVVDDDMRTVFRKVREADALILASPVFFGSLSAQTKIMIDRFQCVWLAKNILKRDVFAGRRAGGFICVEATSREDFFDNARSIVRHFFATINVEYKKEVFCPGVAKKAAVLDHPNVLERAYELGRGIAGEAR